MSNTSPTSLSAELSLLIRHYLQEHAHKKRSSLHKMVMSTAEKALVGMALAYHENNQSKAARVLGISRPTLRTKMVIHTIEPSASIHQTIEQALERYWQHMKGQPTTHFYHIFCNTVEMTLLETVLSFTKGNQRLSADILSISRTTLRSKILDYGFTVN
jgi:Fis family transcriptional regulator